MSGESVSRAFATDGYAANWHPLMFVRKGDPAEALNHIASAVRINPNYADAVRALEALKKSGS